MSQIPLPRSTEFFQQSQYPLIAIYEESPRYCTQAIQELKLEFVQLIQFAWHLIEFPE
jgi:hypothetical protein